MEPRKAQPATVSSVVQRLRPCPSNAGAGSKPAQGIQIPNATWPTATAKQKPANLFLIGVFRAFTGRIANLFSVISAFHFAAFFVPSCVLLEQDLFIIPFLLVYTVFEVSV